MLPYPHFAVGNLFLQNGYQVMQLPDGPAHTYAAEDDLEQCVRRVLIRKPARLRGWDIRFLRRGLALSQADLGKMLDRDAQTVARWEKSKRKIPKLADFAIRCRFAEKFEPSMTVKELTGYVDGSARKLPPFILLTFDGNRWTFSFRPMFSYLQSDASSRATVVLPRGPGATQVVYEILRKHVDVREKVVGFKRGRHGTSTWSTSSQDIDPSISLGKLPTELKMEVKTSEFDYARHDETQH